MQRQGAAYISRQEGARAKITKIYKNVKTVEGITAALLKQIDKETTFAIVMYFVQNHVAALIRDKKPNGPEKTPLEVAKAIIISMRLPNDKLIWDATYSDLSQVEGWAAALQSKLNTNDTNTVGDVWTRAEMAELYFQAMKDKEAA